MTKPWRPTIVTRCCDCGLGTNVAREWFMVKPQVWKEAWAGRRKPWHELPGQSVLCIGCLEQRIGRTLCADDFADTVLHDLEGDISDRLRWRLTATKSVRFDEIDDDEDFYLPQRARGEDGFKVAPIRDRGCPLFTPVKRKRGRPKGSKNKPKVEACKDADADRIDAYVMQAGNDRVPED
jgi:hypothetical protein